MARYHLARFCNVNVRYDAAASAPIPAEAAE